MEKKKTFMKKNSATIGLLLIFITLVILYLIIKRVKPFEADVAKTIFNLKKGSIVEINIASLDDTIIFLKKDNGWMMTKPENYKIDKEKINNLETILTHLKTERIIEKKADDLRMYGLDKPLMTIKLKLKNNGQQTLLIGTESVSKTQYYAAKQSAEKYVFTLAKGIVDNLQKDAFYYRDNVLLPHDFTEITSFYLINNSSGEELKLIKTADNEWQFILPVKATARNDAFVEMINKLRQLEITGYINIKSNEFEKYGLKNPEYHLILEDKSGKSQTICFGKNIDNKIFVKTEKENKIYSIPSNLFNPENIQIGGLLNVAPLSVSIDKINSVIIKDESGTYKFNRITSMSDNVFEINGKEIEKDKFISMYVNIMALSAEGYDTQNYKKTKPEFTIILESINGVKKIKTDFCIRKKDSYFIVIDDARSPFYINDRKINLVKNFLRRIVESN